MLRNGKVQPDRKLRSSLTLSSSNNRDNVTQVSLATVFAYLYNSQIVSALPLLSLFQPIVATIRVLLGSITRVFEIRRDNLNLVAMCRNRIL